MSYQGTSARICAGILGMLESACADDRSGRFSPGEDAVTAALVLRGFFRESRCAAVHQSFMSLLSFSGIPAEVFKQAFYHWMRFGVEEARGPFPDVPPGVGRDSACGLLYSSVRLMLTEPFSCGRVRQLWEEAVAQDPNLTEWVVQRMAFVCEKRWHLRAAVCCLGWLSRRGSLTNAQQMTYALLLLEAGRWAAARAISARREPLTPEDEWRAVFLNHMAGDRKEESLRAAAREWLKEHPGARSLMSMLGPFGMRLYYRLERDAPRRRDLRFARGCAWMLLGEWDAGCFHADALFLGGRFLVGAGMIREMMAVLAAQQQADEMWVDGFSTLSIYASCAGQPAEAKECLALEPLDRAHQAMGWFRLAVAAGLLQHTDEAVGFLERLSQEEPDFFVKQSTPVFWSMAAVLFRTLGLKSLSQQAVLRAEGMPEWPCRREFMNRSPLGAEAVVLPSFMWPDAWSGAEHGGCEHAE